MEVKEAIEWLEVEKQMSYNDRTQECTREVIALLQQGEKYRQIVKSIEWHIKTSKECSPEVYGWLKFIERIIQKYFPKEK